MSKEEMIEAIKNILKANENNPNCSVFWLADMIQEVVTNCDCGTNPDLKEVSDGNN
jgi:hypothetical protein|tara:strand:+ start:1319 stop:1486 length:168 start_codon:yes stop_codon:yes gene_type:complete